MSFMYNTTRERGRNIKCSTWRQTLLNFLSNQSVIKQTHKNRYCQHCKHKNTIAKMYNRWQVWSINQTQYMVTARAKHIITAHTTKRKKRNELLEKKKFFQEKSNFSMAKFKKKEHVCTFLYLAHEWKYILNFQNKRG